MKHHLRLWTALFAMLALVAASCGDAEEEAEVAEPTTTAAAPEPEPEPEPEMADPGTPGNIPDPGTAAGRFDGVEVVVAGPAGQLDYMKDKAAEWAAETGATVRVDEIPFGELNDKVLAALSTDTFIADIINIGSNLGGDLMGGGFMAAAPEWAQERADWEGILPIFRSNQLSFGGVAYGMPWDGDVLMYYWRADAFEAHADAYEAATGNALRPAESWSEYAAIAKFFTENDWSGQDEGYGLVELPMRNNQGWNGFMTRAAGYAKAPNDPGFFFDPETMEPRINNPGFVRALEDWGAVIEYGPPGMLNFGWIENALSFVGGLAAQDIQWGDIGPMSKSPDSVVEGAVGYGPAPGADEYWDPVAEEWASGDGPNKAPFLGFGGWFNLVPATSNHLAAAFDLASFLGSPAVLAEAAVTAGTGVNPGTAATLDVDLWVSAGWPEDEAKAYTDAIRASLDHPNAVFDMRLPGFPEYKDALELAVSEALSGQHSAQDALDEAADKWNEITDRLGRDEQLRIYREALGLTG
ncbi:MAG: extracellular solute-binding protein [bacterium]|nr:extracellular solute-binding protein [bacterium]